MYRRYGTPAPLLIFILFSLALWAIVIFAAWTLWESVR